MVRFFQLVVSSLDSSGIWWGKGSLVCLRVWRSNTPVEVVLGSRRLLALL
jgi:hypothetical protein